MIRWAAALLAVVPLFAQTEPPRKALLVGNAAYQFLPPLATPAADIRALAARLRDVQFQVTVAENRSLDGLAEDIDRFTRDLRPSDVALFYFGGYGIQSGGENYLLPVTFKADDDPDYAAYSVKRVLRGLESKQLSLTFILMDAARRAGAIAQRFPEKGLAILEPRSRETLIAFSALPGQTFSDPPQSTMSVYADNLAKLLERPGLRMLDLFSELKRGVTRASSGEQTPAEVSTTSREFVFRPLPPQAIEWERLSDSRDLGALEDFRRRYPNDPLAAQAARRMERLEWERVSVSRNPEELRAFLRKYPSSEFAAAAQAALSQKNEQQRGADDQAAVIEVLRAYADAYQRKDIERIRALRPTLTRNEVRSLEETFRFARSISMQLEPMEAARIEGDSASLKARVTTQIRADNGPLPPGKADLTVRLRRVGQAWTIESMQ